ncbi:L-seryl-tRNA(Sec) selenium transferase [Neobacillus notoginsengisoli]|uniref:L-seryl-tRNA(Sec) selenium transferase n=1 Tax=Neobacillus notoginsengisoli TaxID=1578198 RepID=A0A417YX09_9BACI|nr:L-seryl-tRNA(Sec) selenium transferase [Neobacillus notoginsengisoli]RHW42137.1 L-seryl-tRNA(Sec) selenium transferase [Neobacillus notoginsengisoli]
MKQLLRSIPPVHELQQDSRFKELLLRTNIDSTQLVAQVRVIVDEVREAILVGNWVGPEPGTAAFTDALFDQLVQKVGKVYSFTLKRVINATGTILHTNLGRARLSEEAIRHAAEVAGNYSNLEYKLEEGERGSRHSHIECLLKDITGAEAAMVVNNNAAAVYLILRALAKEMEVIVSRGQLVEIGGSFRISSIMEESGAKLVEVGTTNKTHLYDYEQAVTEHTAMIMKVHTSNFKTIGFTKTVETDELVQLTSSLDNIVFYEDLGSGALYDFKRHGIGEEPHVREVLKIGADIVSFSGDKLLGGPQAGIIAGKKKLIDTLKKHQLARVVRVDKMTLAALEGTLIDYAKGEAGIRNIPTVRSLLTSQDELKERAERFIQNLIAKSNRYKAAAIPSTGQVGGGTMPDVSLPSYSVSLTHETLSAGQLADKLRLEAELPIIARIHDGEVILDLRTVTREEENIILTSLSQW